MASSLQMGPGRPLNPWLGYSQQPRSTDYPAGVNISTRSRGSWGRTSFETLKAIIDSYDIARSCINHKIDEIRSMVPMFLPQDGVRGDLDTAIDAAKVALAFPDRELPYDAWVSKWLENALRYDAAPLYHRRNFAGEIIGLEVVDGTTIFPYVNEHGRRPKAPAPAFYQVVKGMPWVAFTTEDIEYVPFRPQSDPFGLAPIEALLLNANTDIRFQWHFLQMFTDGSVPAGFIELPPDITSPDQVAEWQDYWDSVVLGDQAKLHQLLAVPNGTKVTNTRPAAFDKAFPEYLASRTAMSFGVVPSDLGIISDVNRSTGETQTDIQFRINTLPWVQYVEGHLNRYLQRGLGLPVKIALDTGRNKEDRLAEAQSWKIYVESGFASIDEARSELLGMPIDNENPMQRFVYTSRGGPIPLSAIMAVSGQTDPETYSPLAGALLPHQPFVPISGVTPQKAPEGAPLAVQIYPEDNQPAPAQIAAPVAPVAQITAAATPVIKSEDERAAFSRFVKGRRQAGRWRDFAFTSVDAVTAHRLNDEGRSVVRKAAGEIVAAGLAVHAEDTGRVLMMQRAFDADEDAAGRWEFPGGHIEDRETPLDAAMREWGEETGLIVPQGAAGGRWTSSNGVYQGFVLDIPSEDALPILDGNRGDDPDGDVVEALAWWSPEDIVNNVVIRDELNVDMSGVQTAIAGGQLLKASAWDDHPARHVEEALTTAHIAPIQSALAESVSYERLRTLVSQYAASHSGG